MTKAKPHHTTHPDIKDEAAVHQQANTALANARRNFSYFVNPTKASPGSRPTRLRTRALLKSLRYITQFILWRLVRWAKYAAVGALIATVGAGLVGSVASGAAFIVAPTGIGASIAAASVWGVGKFLARRFHARWKITGKDLGERVRDEEEAGFRPVERRAGGALGTEVGAQAVPW